MTITTVNRIIGTHGGWDVQYISLEALLEQGAGHSMANYVWPHEGEVRKGKFVFHTGMIKDSKGTETEAPSAPMMVDAQSARAFKLVYDSISDENKTKTRRFVEEHRGLFYYYMTKIVWPNVSYGGR